MPAPEALAEISRKLGFNPAYVQGGGGNTSVKIDDKVMWIKASGMALAATHAETSFVPVDYRKATEAIDRCATESDYWQAMQDAVITDIALTDLRPSLETGFHAFLGATVIHSHSVWANLINCAADGQYLLKQIIPEAHWLPYTTPGLNLTLSIREYLKQNMQISILFLQNHGLIISARDADQAWNIHEDINKRIRGYFNLSMEYPIITADGANPQQLLFPDQAIYDDELSKAAREINAAVGYIHAVLQKLNLQPHYLPANETNILKNMAAEQYRQKIALSRQKQ